MDEIRVLHVLGQTLQEAERLVENHRHCDLGEFLKETRGAEYHCQRVNDLNCNKNASKREYHC